MAMKIRNKTTSDIVLNDLNGITIPSSSDVEFDSGIALEYPYSVDLNTAINNNSIVLVDYNDVELTKQESLNTKNAGYDNTDILTALDGKVDDSQVLTNVPANAVFTDTVYDDTAIQQEVDLNTAKIGVTQDEKNALDGAQTALTGLNYVIDKTTHQANLNTKENSLGNPSTNGDVLSSSTSGTRTWITPFDSSNINNLGNVTITSPASEDVLSFNGTKWVNDSQIRTDINQNHTDIVTNYNAIIVEQKRGRIASAYGNGASIVTFTNTAVSVPFGGNSVTNSFCSIDTTGTTGEVTFNENTNVKIIVSVGILASTTSRSTSITWAELNGVELYGSQSFSYHRNTAQGFNTSNISVVFYATTGDKLVIKTKRKAGGATLKTIPEGISIIVETI